MVRAFILGRYWVLVLGIMTLLAAATLAQAAPAGGVP